MIDDVIHDYLHDIINGYVVLTILLGTIIFLIFVGALVTQEYGDGMKLAVYDAWMLVGSVDW